MPDPGEYRDRKRVSVVGLDGASPEWEEMGRTIGRELGRRGVVLVTDGHQGGAVEAVCQGYKEAGGPLCVGILAGSDRDEAHGCVDLPIVTGMGDTGRFLVGANADVVVAFAGDGGTMGQLSAARLQGVPVVGVGAWERIANSKLVTDADAAVEVLDEFLEGHMSGRIIQPEAA